MKTIKNNNNRRIVIKTIQNLLVATLLLVITACSKDDEVQEPFIIAEAASATFTEVNTCNLTGNVKATKFFTKIKFDATKGIKISKLLVEDEWSSGEKSSWEATKFTIVNGEISFNPCFKFGSTTWVKVNIVLLSMDGIKSNPSIVTINKPSGAN